MPKTNETNNSFLRDEESQCQVPSRQVSHRLTFKEALEKARAQINIKCFSNTDREFANEIIMNIAEVFMIWDASPVKVAGEQIDGYIIKQVFAELKEEHVQLVIDNYRKIDYIVNYKKSYIRTALYNSVFEIEAHYTNLVRHDLGI